jgi:hypothetical protein
MLERSQSRVKRRSADLQSTSVMRLTFPFGLLLLALFSACNSRNTNSLPPDKTAALVSSLTQAPLPPGVTNVYGATASAFTTVVDVRFECSSGELQSFLVASPVLKDELVAGKRTVINTMGRQPWWQPDKLASVNGSQQSWRTTNGAVSASLMSGESGQPGRVVVYLSMTIE